MMEREARHCIYAVAGPRACRLKTGLRIVVFKSVPMFRCGLATAVLVLSFATLSRADVTEGSLTPAPDLNSSPSSAKGEKHSAGQKLPGGDFVVRESDGA